VASWLLTCNLDVFKITDFRRDGQTLRSWTVAQHRKHVAAGDRFVIWLTGENAGVIAHGHLTGPCASGPSDDAEYWVDGDPGVRDYVPLEVDEWLEHMVPSRVLRLDPRMADALIFRMAQGRNPFPLTDGEWDAIAQHIEAVRTEDPNWHLAPGDEIRRVDLHERYGGSSQGGITPSKKTDNILIFTAASSGHQHGYYDEWGEDGAFHYTGEGQNGDQKITRGNKAIYQHRETGKRLRLFEGARGTVRYLGEWTLDPKRPYTEDEAPATGGGDLRKVIKFHMVPVHTAILDPKVEIGHDYVAPDESVQPAAPSPSSADPDLVGRNLSAHRRLQNELAKAAQRRGFEPLSPGVVDPDFDLAWRDQQGRMSVCEVKSLTPANEVRQLRTGLGQILDYYDQLSSRAPDLSAVLWVEFEPADGRWVHLCQRVGVTLAWPGMEDSVLGQLGSGTSQIG
jgi:hypothetical protein